MPLDLVSSWQFFVVTLTSIFFLVDPVATVPAFLVMTQGHTSEHRARMARRAAITCFAVLGGFGSIPGALVGGIVIGLIELYAGATLPEGFKDMAPYIVLLVMLAVRPQGLFGR